MIAAHAADIRSVRYEPNLYVTSFSPFTFGSNRSIAMYIFLASSMRSSPVRTFSISTAVQNIAAEAYGLLSVA